MTYSYLVHIRFSPFHDRFRKAGAATAGSGYSWQKPRETATVNGWNTGRAYTIYNNARANAPSGAPHSAILSHRLSASAARPAFGIPFVIMIANVSSKITLIQNNNK